MSKPACVLALALFLPGLAVADPALALEWGQRASALHQATSNAIGGEPLAPQFEDSVARFAVTANRLGSWIDATGGAADLGCIFRGMADEAELQLQQVALPEARQPALRRLASLFNDAEAVALAAARAEPTPTLEAEPTGQCPANPHAAYQYLTEQP